MKERRKEKTKNPKNPKAKYPPLYSQLYNGISRTHENDDGSRKGGNHEIYKRMYTIECTYTHTGICLYAPMCVCMCVCVCVCKFYKNVVCVASCIPTSTVLLLNTCNTS